MRPAAVLEGRKARAAGYASLFEAMARLAGLEAAIVPGFVKGVSTGEDERPTRPNHVWNAVRIDGAWQLIDPTLGAGYVRHKRFHRTFQDQFFLPPAQHLLLTHFPADPRWQLVAWPMGPRQWDALPYVDLMVFSTGVTFEMLWRQMQSAGFRGFVRLHAELTAARVLAAPLGQQLTTGQDYYFAIDAPQATHIYFLANDRPMHLRKNGTRFEGIIRPQPGTLKVNVQRLDRSTQTMFTYKVE